MEKHTDTKAEDCDFLVRCHGCNYRRNTGKGQFLAHRTARNHHNKTQHPVEVCKIITVDWYYPNMTRLETEDGPPF